MIPVFPKFKKLELEDKEEVEKMVSRCPPYSDFNFISLWCWDLDGNLLLSSLNGNLVVRFADYLSGQPFYSFLGGNMAEETALALLELSKKEILEPRLRLISEEAAGKMKTPLLSIREDRDNFDYILPTRLLQDFDSENSLVRRKKRAVNSLRKEFSPKVEALDLSRPEDAEKVRLLLEKTQEDKAGEREPSAIHRLIEGSRVLECIALGAFVNSSLSGFCFSEVLADGFANFHFWKADIRNYKPMYSFLLQETARLLIENHGCEFLNIEQDLGIENLRRWKSSFGAPAFLKKYTVAFSD